MSDQVIGVAILDPVMVPQRLIVCCHKASGQDVPEIISVYPRGAQKPETYNDAAWAYEVKGDRLLVTPSLHVKHQKEDGTWQTDFHNVGSWEVRFVLADGRPRDPAWLDHLYQQYRDLGQ